VFIELITLIYLQIYNILRNKIVKNTSFIVLHLFIIIANANQAIYQKRSKKQIEIGIDK
jgi:hypothetical protein